MTLQHAEEMLAKTDTVHKDDRRAYNLAWSQVVAKLRGKANEK